MNYHLNRQGQNVGVFPLEELRRRRGAGECQGDDLVWCEGMSTWQRLDSVLQTGGPGGPGSAPPVISMPTAKRKTNRTLVAVMVAGAVLVLAVLTLLGIAAVQFAKRVRPVLDGLNAGGGGRVGG
jgi:GYF domain 2